jgi:hypothetical protein
VDWVSVSFLFFQDAGEFEIEDIGDESKMEDDDSVSHKPLPQYGILKDEAKE